MTVGAPQPLIAPSKAARMKAGNIRSSREERRRKGKKNSPKAESPHLVLFGLGELSLAADALNLFGAEVWMTSWETPLAPGIAVGLRVHVMLAGS